ncbi:MAG TPA: hypothetical protein VEW71_09780 [Allosphingosinicella sp.]|nr:hypothetical protein [Allosphingosinicella sp.]
MESVLLAAALLAAAPTQSPVNEPVSPAALDERCFRLMADLAEDEDPRIRGLGRMAAQYFLGRLDQARPGFDPAASLEAAAPAGPERRRLLGACGDAMQAGGRDFRSIGQALAPPRRPTI